MTKADKIKKKPSKLNVVDLSVNDLVPDEDNPNQMDEATFDALVEEIQEQGFDEPVLVRVHPKLKGKYQIGSGHHRVKAAIVAGLNSVPVVIKDWSDREQKAALAKRNALRGQLDREKMVKLYRSLIDDKHDAITVQRELGFTDPKTFEKMYDAAEKNLPPKAKKKLQAAKETIKSVDDLTSVLNKIFTESGSELDEGYMVFSFGGKNHHYFQINQKTEDKLQEIIAYCDSNGIVYADFIQSIVCSTKLEKPKRKRGKK